MVVGGGDSAMEEANFLTRFGREVALVHRRDQFRASKIMLDRARANPKIKFLTNTVVEEVYDVKPEPWSPACGCATSPRARCGTSDSGRLFRGHRAHPQHGGLQGADRHSMPDGYIVSKGGARTNIAGVFHAGDVQDRVYRQAITASGAGCMAAIEAERYLEAEGH